MDDNEVLLIEKFLKDNYHLFTIMGVFGALSIYLKEILPPDDNFFQIAIVASFTLFILISLIICLKIRQNLVDMSHDVSLRIIFENLLLILFVTPIYFLVIIVTAYIFYSFQRPLEIFSGFITLFVGMIVSFGILSLIEIKVKSKILYVLCVTFIVIISIIIFRYILYTGPILSGLKLILFFFVSSIVVVSASYLVTKLLDFIPPLR